MHLDHRYSTMLSVAFATGFTLGCSELSKVAGPSSGGIQITVTTIAAAGEDRDADGFLVSIDSGGAARVPATGMSVKNLSFGTHSVTLGGIAPNCSAHPNPQIVELSADSPSVATFFEVQCQPNVGSLTVSTSMSGEELPTKGLLVLLPRNKWAGVPVDGSVTISDLRAGVFNIGLDGVPVNCDHLGSPVRPTEIVFGKTVEVEFTLRCAATGRLLITTTTSGVDPDLNGYNAEVSNRARGTTLMVPLPANGNTELSGLVPGDYTLALSDIVNNCDAKPVVASDVGVTVGNATPVTFDVACEATGQIAYVSDMTSASRIASIRSNGSENFMFGSQTGGNFDPGWSRDGSQLAFTSDRDGTDEIYTMNSDGRSAVRLTTVAGMNYRPAWSPDGSKIAFVSEREGNAEIYVMDADGTNSVRLTNNPARDDAPSWSADGTRIAFQSDRDGQPSVWTMNSNGSGPVRLPGTLNGDLQPSWSPDGTKIAFSRQVSSSLRDIFMINVDGSHLTQLSFDYFDAADPSWSPDGRQIVFSATFCDGYDFYYYSTCTRDVLLARTDGRVLPSTPILAAGYNPAWRQ